MAQAGFTDTDRERINSAQIPSRAEAPRVGAAAEKSIFDDRSGSRRPYDEGVAKVDRLPDG